MVKFTVESPRYRQIRILMALGCNSFLLSFSLISFQVIADFYKTTCVHLELSNKLGAKFNVSRPVYLQLENIINEFAVSHL